MITNEIYFFKNQSSASTSDSLYNVNDGTLILQVDGDVSNLELLVLGNTDLVDDDFVALKTINASDYSINGKITSTGIYWIDINGIRKIKLNLSKITGSVNVKALTKRGLTTDLVARAMAANASGGGSYTLPVASASTLGGIKVGENLTITEDGTLSAADGGNNLFKDENIKHIDHSTYTRDNPYMFSPEDDGELFIYEGGYFKFPKSDKLFSSGLPYNQMLLCKKGHVHPNIDDYYFSSICNLANINTIATVTCFSKFTDSMTTDKVSLYTVDLSSEQNIFGEKTFTKLPKSSITPTEADQFTRKGYVDAVPTTYAGYDATKTQVLKNINGTLTWVTEE